MPPEDREITKVKGSSNAVVAAASLPAKDLPISLGNKNKTIDINLANDPKVHFPPAVKNTEPEQTGFLPNVGKFFSDLYSGLKKAAGYVPNIPESIVYVVALNVPSVLRAVASLVVIPAKCVLALFSSEKFDFGKILAEEKEAILMVEPKSRWINAVRGFFNEYVPGGSLFGNDEVFAGTTDEKLKEIINPLSNISKAIVEPLTTPLHEVAQGLTDRVTYIGYNTYLHFSKEKSLSYNYSEFLKEVEEEKNWHLRMGRTAIYTVEAVAIAYYCGGAGAKSKLEALKRTSDFLKMPVVMTALQAAGSVLKREDIQELTTKQIVAEVLTQIPKGVFDSAVFMLPISKLSQWKIERGINKLNQQMLASSTSAKLPIPIGQYQADVNKLVARTQAWSELFDFAEGMPDAQTKGVELKDCLVQLAYNPFSATNWRLTGATTLEFTSSALDLVDAKHNKGHQESLHSVSENAQSNVDESLKGNTYELSGGIEEVQQYFRDHHYRKLSIQGVESVLSYFGITTLSSQDQLRKEIEKRSKSVCAFYDGERDVIFVPKITESASREEKQLHQSFIEHEEFHRRVAQHPEGIVGVLSEEPVLSSFIEQIIVTNQQQNIDLLLQTPQGRKQLEEYAATSKQVIYLEEQGIYQYSESLINSSINHYTLDFIPGIFAGDDSDATETNAKQLFQSVLRLVSQLSHNNYSTRQSNIEKLRKLKETGSLATLNVNDLQEVTEHFVLGLSDDFPEDVEIKATALLLLKELDLLPAINRIELQKGVSELVSKLSDPDPYVVQTSTKTLKNLSAAGLLQGIEIESKILQKGVENIVSKLNDPEPLVVLVNTEALKLLQEMDLLINLNKKVFHEFTTTQISNLLNQDAHIRLISAETLETLNNVSLFQIEILNQSTLEEIIEKLVAGLNDDDPLIRRFNALSLNHLKKTNILQLSDINIMSLVSGINKIVSALSANNPIIKSLSLHSLMEQHEVGLLPAQEIDHRALLVGKIKLLSGLRNKDIISNNALVIELLQKIGLYSPEIISEEARTTLYTFLDQEEDSELKREVAILYYLRNKQPTDYILSEIDRMFEFWTTEQGFTKADYDRLIYILENNISDFPLAKYSSFIACKYPGRISNIKFEDGGIAESDFYKHINSILGFPFELEIERPAGFPAEINSESLVIPILEKNSGLDLELKNESKQFGRTIVYQQADGKCLAVKLLKAKEDPAVLAREYEMMNFLYSKKDEWGLKGKYPQGKYKIVKISTSQLPAVSQTIKAENWYIDLEVEDSCYFAMVYEAAEDYFTYINDPNLSHQEFEKQFEINVHDLLVLAQHGIFNTEIIELFHNQNNGARIYNWMRDVSSEEFRDGAGRLNNIPKSTLYPNLRLSGPADFASMQFIGDLTNDPQFRHLADDRIAHLLEKHGKSAIKYIYAAYLGDLLLALSLMPATYLQRRGELNYENESDEIESFLVKQLMLMFGSELGIDYQLIAKEIAFFMTGRYVSENIPEEFYPKTNARLLRSGRGYDEVRGHDNNNEEYIVPSNSFESKITVHSYDLGPVNGPNPLQALIWALYVRSAKLTAEFANIKPISIEAAAHQIREDFNQKGIDFVLSKINSYGLAKREVAIVLAKHNVLELVKSLEKFQFSSADDFYSLALESAKKQGKLIAKEIKRFGNLDNTQLYNIALVCAKHSGEGTALNIGNFDGLSNSQLFEIALECARENGTATAFNIQYFKGLSTDQLYDVALECAKQSGYGTAGFINNFIGLTSEQLFNIVMECAKGSAYGTAKYIENFQGLSNEQLFLIALECTKHDVLGILKYIGKFADLTTKQLFDIALVCAKKNGSVTAENIQNFKGLSSTQLFDLAKECAKQNALKTSEHLHNFNLILLSESDIFPDTIKEEFWKVVLKESFFAGNLENAVSVLGIFEDENEIYHLNKLINLYKNILFNETLKFIKKEYTLSASEINYLNSIKRIAADTNWGKIPEAAAKTLCVFMTEAEQKIVEEICLSYGSNFGANVCAALVDIFSNYPGSLVKEKEIVLKFCESGFRGFSKLSYQFYKEAYLRSPADANKLVAEWETIGFEIAIGTKVEEDLKKDPLYPSLVYNAYHPADMTVDRVRTLLKIVPDNSHHQHWLKDVDRVYGKNLYEIADVIIKPGTSLDLKIIEEVSQKITTSFIDVQVDVDKNVINFIAKVCKGSPVKIEDLLSYLIHREGGERIKELATSLMNFEEVAENDYYTYYHKLTMMLEFFTTAHKDALAKVLEEILEKDPSLLSYAKAQFAKQKGLKINLENADAIKDQIIERLAKLLNKEILSIKKEIAKLRTKDGGTLRSIYGVVTKTPESYFGRAAVGLSTKEDHWSWDNENYLQMIIFDGATRDVVGNIQLHIFELPGSDQKGVIIRINPKHTFLEEVDKRQLASCLMNMAIEFATINNITPYLPEQSVLMILTNRADFAPELQRYQDPENKLENINVRITEGYVARTLLGIRIPEDLGFP